MNIKYSTLFCVMDYSFLLEFYPVKFASAKLERLVGKQTLLALLPSCF
jgi:hypothetical protein